MNESRPVQLTAIAVAVVHTDPDLAGPRNQRVPQSDAGICCRADFKPGLHVRVRTTFGVEGRGIVHWSRDGEPEIQLVEHFPMANAAC